MSAVATVRSTPGLATYLDALEARLADAVSAHPGVVADASAETVGAGGKRLRPVLVFLSTPHAGRGDDRTVAAGVAVELVHVATLVHDDLLDGARIRRGEATVWALHGEAIARAVGDYLFARAFAELAATRDAEAVAVLAQAALSLARGEALQRRHAFRPDTPVDEYLARCSLKTGKLFEAACLLGGGRRLAAFGRALGIAFQIVDDILDCTGDADETGKAPGVDLRDGTPTLPLILAARRDERVRRALGGDDAPDALASVAATGALDDARSVALEYARRARAALDGELDRESLEALTHAVVERRS
jgi:geranylgeranyl pyrophosphate synthase